MVRAGYRYRDAWIVFLFTKLMLGIGLLALAFFFIFVLKLWKVKAAPGLLIVAGSGFLGWVLPNVIVKNMTQKREEMFRKSLPDALDLLVICAEAGLSLDAAFERVSREIGLSSPELGEEIGLTAVELGFLPERSKALQNFAERVPLPGAMALVNTLIQTEKYGTPLAQALRVLSAEIRDERMMRAEEKAARLPATLTVPMILFILPPLFVVIMGPAIIKVMSAMAHR
jgi:tight adherence protein C